MKKNLLRWYLMLFLVFAACCFPMPSLHCEAVYAPVWIHQNDTKTNGVSPKFKAKTKYQRHFPHKGERTMGILFLLAAGIGFWAALIFILGLIGLAARFGITLLGGLLLGVFFSILLITVLNVIYAIHYIDNSYSIYSADKQVAWSRRLRQIIVGWVLAFLYTGAAIGLLFSPWIIISAIFFILAAILLVLGILNFLKHRPEPSTGVDNSTYPQPK